VLRVPTRLLKDAVASCRMMAGAWIRTRPRCVVGQSRLSTSMPA
jgi:hypothetical protein